MKQKISKGIIAIVLLVSSIGLSIVPTNAANLWCRAANYPLLRTWTWRQQSSQLPTGWYWGYIGGYTFSPVFQTCW